MRTKSYRFRLTAALAAFALLVGPMMPTAAFAQTDAQVQDPPGRVGRVARLSGTVSYHGAEQTQWEPAVLNFPVSSGSAFWTEPRGGADLDVAGTRIVMGEGTQFDIDQLTDHAMTATLAQGSVFMSVRGMQPGDTLQVRTPRGTVTIVNEGQYDLAAGDSEHPTLISVARGQAQVSGDNVSLIVADQQTGQITGSGPFEGSVGALASRPMLQTYAAPTRVVPTGDYAPPPVVQEMTGGEALAETGRWDRTAEYGQIWYPPVERGWVPYRNGHWAFVAPWGWTWVDDAAWGFAPFHYGRWVEYGGAWGWSPVVPGVSIGFGYRPAYAPALVAFVGLGIGVAIGASFGRSVGWVPLGPREAYYPPYRTSTNYIRNVNVTNVTNVNNITTVNNFNGGAPLMNRAASTVVPATAMTGSQPVGRNLQGIPAGTQLQPVQGQPIAPTTGTRGVTPAVASQLNLAAAAPGTAAPRPASPGPAVRQAGAAGAIPLRAPGSQAGTPGIQQPGIQQPGIQQPGIQQPGIPQAGQQAPLQQQRPATGIPTPGAPVPAAIPPGAAGGQAAVPRPASPQISGAPQQGAPSGGTATGGAPGPAFTPRQALQGGAAAPLPQLRPTAPLQGGLQQGAPAVASPGLNAPAGARPGAGTQPFAPRPTGPTPAPSPGPSPGPGAGQAPGPAIGGQAPQQGNLPQLRQPGQQGGPLSAPRAAPQVAAPRPAAPTQQVTPGQPPAQAFQRQAPAPQAPAPQPPAPQAPAPQVQRPTPSQLVAPPVQRVAPPQQAAPPVQRVAPPQQAAPQVQRVAPPQPSAPQVQRVAPPAPRPAPPPQAAPPQQHAAPQPAPAPRPAPPPQPQRQAPHNCPANRPNC